MNNHISATCIFVYHERCYVSNLLHIKIDTSLSRYTGYKNNKNVIFYTGFLKTILNSMRWKSDILHIGTLNLKAHYALETNTYFTYLERPNMS
jgi:hypothetical protein